MSAPALPDHEAGSSTLRTRLLGLVGLLIAIAIACLPKLDNDFVWDDIPMILESDRLFDASNLPSVFWHDTMYTSDGGKFQAQAQLDTYRPI
ncbi:MAG TPA: hypothetical protein VMF89_30060, partial [Polyangiales bacterium]|nr:hypothetical protein [Polyangiales bacterium]